MKMKRRFAGEFKAEAVGLVDEVSPSITGCIDDVVVAFEDAVGKPVGAHVLPDVLDRVQFRGAGWQKDQCDVGRHSETGCRVPSCAIK